MMSFYWNWLKFKHAHSMRWITDGYYRSVLNATSWSGLNAMQLACHSTRIFWNTQIRGHGYTNLILKQNLDQETIKAFLWNRTIYIYLHSIMHLHHNDVIQWKHLPRHWPFVNSPNKGQWRGALMFSLICVWINGWENNREAGDLRCPLWHHCNDVMAYCSVYGNGCLVHFG